MDNDIIKNEILQGLLQVDSSFVITDFFSEFDSTTRKLSVSFVAQTDKGETVSEVLSYA